MDPETKARDLLTAIEARSPGAVRMAALYGSVVRGDWNPERSDINILIVLDKLDRETLASLSGPVQQARDRDALAPLFLRADELAEIAALFPAKIHEIKLHHRLVEGPDLLAGVEVSSRDLALRVRQELLNVRMRLRHALLMGTPSPALLIPPMQAFLPRLHSLLRSLPSLGVAEAAGVADQLRERWKGPERTDLTTLLDLYGFVLSRTEELASSLARMH